MTNKDLITLIDKLKDLEDTYFDFFFDHFNSDWAAYDSDEGEKDGKLVGMIVALRSVVNQMEGESTAIDSLSWTDSVYVEFEEKSKLRKEKKDE